jgi:hypothetical protein
MMRKCSQFGQKLERVHCQVVAITKPEIATGEKVNDCHSFVSTHHYTGGKKTSKSKRSTGIFLTYDFPPTVVSLFIRFSHTMEM